MSEAVLVEDVKERPLRVAERSLKSTSAIDRARIAVGIEAFDQIPAWFSSPNDAPDVDVCGRLSQPQTPIASTNSGNQPLLDQRLHYLHDVVR